MPAQAKYGIDAPTVIRNLLGCGVLALILIWTTPTDLRFGRVVLRWHYSLDWIAASMFVTGILMLVYGMWGKFLHRDRMLNLRTWRGDERVLDIGTGRGLLLVGAAKRLTSGHATGIDLWNPEDLSGNSLRATTENLQVEGVAGKCTLLTVAAQSTGFPDGSFDVVLSNLCLHNIYDRAQRREACREIARVLAPGGMAIISDYKLTAEYARNLSEAGLVVERRPANWLTTFPALAIVLARKAPV